MRGSVQTVSERAGHQPRRPPSEALRASYSAGASRRAKRPRKNARVERTEIGLSSEISGATQYWHSAIEGRTTRHTGYAESQHCRKRIEEAFGWVKTVAGPRQTKLRGRSKVA